MKKFFVALAVMIFFASTACAQSVRIARLPIIFQSTIPDEKTCDELETKIARAVHIPLNGTLQLAEYLDPKISAQTLNDIWQENKQTHLADAMKNLAEKIDADIIVCPVLKDYSQYVSFSAGWGETILISRAEAELIVYDRRTDELIDKKKSQFHHDDYNLRGTASFLAKNCFDNVIESSGLRKKIRDIR